MRMIDPFFKNSIEDRKLGCHIKSLVNVKHLPGEIGIYPDSKIRNCHPGIFHQGSTFDYERLIMHPG
jgi:hypothetical protein